MLVFSQNSIKIINYEANTEKTTTKSEREKTRNDKIDIPFDMGFYVNQEKKSSSSSSVVFEHAHLQPQCAYNKFSLSCRHLEYTNLMYDVTE